MTTMNQGIWSGFSGKVGTVTGGIGKRMGRMRSKAPRFRRDYATIDAKDAGNDLNQNTELND